MVAVNGLGLLGVAASLLLSYPQGSVTGEIVASGDPHGTFVVHPVTCYSGSHWGFSGLWLVTEMQTSGNKRGFTGGLKVPARACLHRKLAQSGYPPNVPSK